MLRLPQLREKCITLKLLLLYLTVMNRLCHPNGSDVFQSLQNTRLWCEKPLTFLNSVGPCRIYVLKGSQWDQPR